MSKNVARCCGISFRDSPTTILQSLLISLPLVYCLALVQLLILPYQFLFGRRTRPTILRSLLISQFSQIRDAAFAPRLRCQCSTKFYHISPRLSGFVFRTFNFLLLTGIWGMAVSVMILATNML